MTSQLASRIWKRWLEDECGQDVIEYALLASFLGFGAVVGVSLVSAAMNDTYTAWDDAAQSDTLVEMPEPQ